jgi:hypothetical protein
MLFADKKRIIPSVLIKIIGVMNKFIDSDCGKIKNMNTSIWRIATSQKGSCSKADFIVTLLA